ncbi:MAG: hypothetical protein LQ338_004998 [Usnochroma carphineum]|nr:MAG: hypothetical protein LQ338_004998 [Usnochroma carphineum]
MRGYTQFLVVGHVVTCLAVYVRASHHSFPLPLRDIHQFPLTTYLQDVAVAYNGDVYMTSVFPDASIYSVSNATTSTPTTSLVHKFDDINAATGITETQPGVFNFIAGRQSSLGVGIHGTFGVFELDTRHGKPIITELVNVPDGGLIVGVIPVPGMPNTLLVSDSTLGNVRRVDTATRTYEEVLHDASMKSPPWAPLPFGIGGIQLHKGYLYFVACYEAIIYRIRFTDDGYPAPGAEVELVLALRSIYIDNFVIGPGDDDTIWAATNADNRLFAITPDGNVTVVAGAPDKLTIAGAVAGAFGRLPGDNNTLYVVTSGGMLNPVNGTLFEGGKVVAVNTTSFLEDSKPSNDLFFPSSKVRFSTQQPVDKGLVGCTLESSLELFHRILSYIIGR